MAAHDDINAKQQRKWRAAGILGIALLVLLPGLIVARVDYALRAHYIGTFSPSELQVYRVSAVASSAFWGGLLWASVTGYRRIRLLALALLLFASVLVLGQQAYTFSHYRSYVDVIATLSGTTLRPELHSRLRFDTANAIACFFGPAIACGLLWAVFSALLRYVKKSREPGRQSAWGLDLAVCGAMFAAVVNPNRAAEQGLLPDVLWGCAWGQTMRAYWDHNRTVERVHPAGRLPDVANIQKPPKKLAGRSVLFVVNESVRAMDTCVEFTEPCLVTPFSNRAAKHRAPLLGMRAMDSTTTISLGVMWTGLPPGVGLDDLRRAPLLWEYAQAAGIPIAYWTAQDLLFGNQGKWVEAVHFDDKISARELEEAPSLDYGADDGALVDHVLKRLPLLPDPFFGVVHFSNTHYPYGIDKKDAPFQPESDDTAPASHELLENRYRDAIYHQDRGFGRLIDGVYATGRPIVIVYLSDHGEQLHEHGPHGHTGSLYEPEVRVPAWLDGALTESERAGLAKIKNAPRLQIDVAPTVLELLGLDAAVLAPTWAAKMPGKSLLRGGSEGPHFVTNCSAFWECDYPNWGAIDGEKKLLAGFHDWDWRCFDVARDPEEKSPLPLDACKHLKDIAETRGRPFPKRP
jgi:Sulfatase